MTGSGNKKRAQAARQRARRASAGTATRRPVPGPAAGRRGRTCPSRRRRCRAPGPRLSTRSPSPADQKPVAAGWAERALEEVLIATCWLDPGEDGEPYPVTVRFSGRRTGVAGTSASRPQLRPRGDRGAGRPWQRASHSHGDDPGHQPGNLDGDGYAGQPRRAQGGAARRPAGNERQLRLRRVRIPALGRGSAPGSR